MWHHRKDSKAEGVTNVVMSNEKQPLANDAAPIANGTEYVPCMSVLMLSDVGFPNCVVIVHVVLSALLDLA